MTAQILNFITWDCNPDLISSPITIRWYGLMFAIGFILGAWILSKMFKHEGERSSWVDSIFVIVVICTIVGARLGHVFFYAWDYYSQHPSEILKVWEGGLASHGGAIGILIGICLYSYFVTKRSPLWLSLADLSVWAIFSTPRFSDMSPRFRGDSILSTLWNGRTCVPNTVTRWLATLRRFMRLFATSHCSDC